MPPKQRYYEPLVEGAGDVPTTLPEVRALELPLAGHYLLASDVVALLRAYAEHVGPDAAEALRDVATAWDQSEPLQEPPGEAERVELYPDTTGKWYGRSVDAKGRVIEWTGGDFNIRGVEQEIEQRWPGLPIYQLQTENDDSTWEGMGPSPRLWRIT